MATPTAKCLLTAVFSLNIALFCANFISFFDLDELDDVKYGIDIINTPVLSGKADDSNIMYMKSKYGQQYECKLPDMEDHEKEQEEEKLASEIGISELLKPMEAQPCLIKTKGWWTYEFCYRKTIRQYHMDDGNIIGDVISLGNYHSEMDWSTNSNSSETKRHKINRYHSHLYKNGSVCDLTQRQRESEVRFMCDEVGLDTIHRVDEPSSCMYLITIHTNRVCKHPFLRPPTSLKPKPILCYPALNKEQFDEFTDKQNQEENKRIELQKTRLKAFEEVVTKQKAETERATALLNSQNEKEGILESHDIVLSKSDLYKTIPDTIESVVDLKEEFRKGIPEQKPYGIDTRRYLSQTLLDLSYDLDAVVQKLSRDHPLMNALSENVEEIVDELHKYATDLDKNIEEVITEKDVERVYYFYEHATSLINVLGKVADDKTLLNFMKTDITSDIDLELDVVFRTEEELKEWLFTIADMLNRPDTDPEKMKWLQETLNAKRKPPAEDTLAVTISTEFLKLEEDDKKDDKKVEKEVEQKEDGEDDEEEASIETEEEEDALLVKEFKEGLDEIKPDKAKLAEMSDKLHESILDQFDDILAETQEDFNDDSIFDHIDYKVAAKKLAATLTTLLESIDDKQVLNEKRRKLDENEKDAAENSEKKVRTARGGYGIDDDDDDDDDDDKETTGKKVPTSTGGIGLTDDYEDDDDDDDRVRVRVTKVNIAGEQMQKETEIYDSKYRKIEKAVQEDLENAGINPDGKIEVKIIAYDPNDDESGMTVLSEEETTYFKDMIIGILGGGQETTNEAIRHQRLEDNYNFVWGETSSSQQSTLDSDDAE